MHLSRFVSSVVTRFEQLGETTAVITSLSSIEPEKLYISSDGVLSEQSVLQNVASGGIEMVHFVGWPLLTAVSTISELFERFHRKIGECTVQFRSWECHKRGREQKEYTLDGGTVTKDVIAQVVRMVRLGV